MKRVIYFAPLAPGGLADYALCQARAIAALGWDLTFLGTPELVDRIEGVERVRAIALPSASPRPRLKMRRAARMVAQCREQSRILRNLVRETGVRRVLIAAFAEYFAPFWAHYFRALHAEGVQFGVVVHDPVRGFIIGPRRWHEWSVSLAYSFVDVAFTHGAVSLDTGKPSRNVPTVEIPHGIYEFPKPTGSVDALEVRKELGLPEHATVLLSFGHIRDGKNLDLVIRAIADLPDVHLMVAGREQSSSQRPVDYYRDLASSIGVADRCHWHHRFIDQDEAWRYFMACDFVLLTYSRGFASASGVLNVAAAFEKPVLASSGDGPLRDDVKRYHLGGWCEPDRGDALARMIRDDPEQYYRQNWRAYKDDHSWRRNAEICMQHLQ